MVLAADIEFIRLELQKTIELQSWHWVHVTHIINPHNFYVRKTDYCNFIEKMESNKPLVKCSSVNIHDFVIVNMNESNEAEIYARGKIMQINNESGRLMCDVFLLDYGDIKKLVPIENIWICEQELRDLPQLTLLCELANCAPIGGDTEWTEKTIDAFKFFVGTERARINIQDKTFVDSETSDLVFNKKVYECDYDFQSELPSQSALLGTDDELAQLLTADGPLEEPDLNGPATLHCEICQKRFDNAKKYYGHLRVHSKDNLWICEKCPNQKFSTKQQLMKHSLTHKPLARVWKCPQCSMAFESLWRLQQHVFTKHFDYRPHKCDQCEKSFQKPSDLKKHQDIHNDVKKHICPYCEREFGHKSNLKRHMLTHTNEKPFSCTGCNSRFTQIASLKRHQKNCILFSNSNETEDKTRKNHCRVCGETFQYKSALIEHCVRQHSNANANNEDKLQINQVNIDTNRTEDNIVDDILSAEDDYMTMSSQTLQSYNQQAVPDQNTYDNLMQIEFLKEMNQLHILDEDEEDLLYNDIDFDSFNTNNNINSDIDYINDRTGIFDDMSSKVDQDLMSALYHVKADLPDDILNVETPKQVEIPNLVPQSTVPVNECATIFESDVDLEASTNLAANLNQLIGENTVQYISTEDDDMFIIRLNSEIDAEQLTDMLNIGVEVVNTDNDKTEVHNDINKEVSNDNMPIVIKIENVKETDQVESSKLNKKCKKQVLYVCSTCDKIFKKKDNYRSHIATHSEALRRHCCRTCGARFSYRSTLVRHAARHRPRDHPPARPYRCGPCARPYAAKWMLKNHIERDHERLTPHACDAQGCTRKFYKKCDLDVHKRYHTGERPYVCNVCQFAFLHVSHLRRHQQLVDCKRRLERRQRVEQQIIKN